MVIWFKRVAFDIDGVLANTFDRIKELTWKTEIKYYNVSECGIDFNSLESSEFYSMIEPNKYWIDELNNYKKNWAKIFIITARPFKYYQETIDWLERMGIQYDEIFFTHNKKRVIQENQVELIYEDSLENAVIIDNCKVFLVDREYNREEEISSLKHKYPQLRYDIKKHLERIERVYESYEMQLNVSNLVDKVYVEDFIAELPNA